MAGELVDHRPGGGRASAAKLIEVPVGFKWFVDGLIGGTGFGGEESAGRRSCARTAPVGTTDKDGIIMGCWPGDPRGHREDPAAALRGTGRRVRRPSTPGRRARQPGAEGVLGKLSAEQVTATELAGEPITACSPPRRATGPHRRAADHRRRLVRRDGRRAPRTSTRSTPSRSWAAHWRRCKTPRGSGE